MIVVTSISSLLNLGTIFILISVNQLLYLTISFQISQNKGIQRVEKLLLLHSLISFGIMLFAAIITVGFWSVLIILSHCLTVSLYHYLSVSLSVSFSYSYCIGTFQVFNYFGVDDMNRDSWYAVVGQQLLPFVSDGLTLISPFLLLICSSNLRAAVLGLFKGYPVTPVISVSYRH